MIPVQRARLPPCQPKNQIVPCSHLAEGLAVFGRRLKVRRGGMEKLPGVVLPSLAEKHHGAVEPRRAFHVRAFAEQFQFCCAVFGGSQGVMCLRKISVTKFGQPEPELISR